MEENGIVKAAIFKSHYDAAQQMPVEERCAFYDAMFRYQFTGEISDDLSPAIKWVMTAILPVLDKEVEGRQGGRPECDIPAEEIAAKKEELGSAEACAEHFGISRRTVYNKLQSAKSAKTASASCAAKVQSAKSAKTKEERRTKNEERGMEKEEWRMKKEEEREGAPCAPAAAEPPAPPPQPSSISAKTAVEFPAERARRTPPPTREEVRALCKEQGYSFDPDTFFAYYAATGWRRKSGAKVSDWVAEAELWQAREKKGEGARASPQYKTWHAEEQPAISEEERAAVAEGLRNIFGKLAQKCVNA